jgi:dienelactone hydrolase
LFIDGGDVRVLVHRRTAIQSLATAGLGTVMQGGGPLTSGLCGSTAVPGFEASCFTDTKGERHQLYAVGQGPPVLLLHELPGLVDHDLAAARCLAGLGYRVIAPLFFGTPGRRSNWFTTGARVLAYSVSVCGDDEFACAEDRRTSPIVSWLRELSRAVRAEWPDGNGVGVIGMCLTGAFPIALLQEPSVAAAVVCQPTAPFSTFDPFGWFNDDDALALDPVDVENARTRSDAPILGLRYTRDGRCPAARFERLAREFSTRFYRLDIAGKGHSTLAFDFCPEAFDEVRRFLNRFVRGGAGSETDRFPLRSKRNSPVEVPIAACAERKGKGPHGCHPSQT